MRHPKAMDPVPGIHPGRCFTSRDSSASLEIGAGTVKEGAGYAGGITSAAVDGLRCAEAVTANMDKKH